MYCSIWKLVFSAPRWVFAVNIFVTSSSWRANRSNPPDIFAMRTWDEMRVTIHLKSYEVEVTGKVAKRTSMYNAHATCQWKMIMNRRYFRLALTIDQIELSIFNLQGRVQLFSPVSRWIRWIRNSFETALVQNGDFGLVRKYCWTCLKSDILSIYEFLMSMDCPSKIEIHFPKKKR